MNSMAVRIKNPHVVISTSLMFGCLAFSLIPDLYLTRKSIQVVFMILWYIESFAIDPRKSKFRDKRIIAILFSFFIVQLIYQALGVSDIAVGNYFTIWVFNDVVIKAAYIKQVYNNEQKQLIFRTIQIFLVVMILALVNQKRYDIDASFYNMLAFSSGISFFYIFKDRRLAYKMLDIILIILSVYFMLTFTPRLTALLVFLLMVFLLVINSIKRREHRCLMLGGFIVLGLLFMHIVMKELVVYLPERIQVRVNAMINGDGISNVYLGRFSLILGTLKTYVSSVKTFVMGIGYHFGYEYWSGPRMIGQHSLITDYLAAYGALGLLFLVAFFRELWRMLSRKTMYIAIVKTMYMAFAFASVVTRSFVPPIAIGGILLTCLIEIDQATEEVYRW